MRIHMRGHRNRYIFSPELQPPERSPDAGARAWAGIFPRSQSWSQSRPKPPQLCVIVDKLTIFLTVCQIGSPVHHSGVKLSGLPILNFRPGSSGSYMVFPMMPWDSGYMPWGSHYLNTRESATHETAIVEWITCRRSCEHPPKWCEEIASSLWLICRHTLLLNTVMQFQRCKYIHNPDSWISAGRHDWEEGRHLSEINPPILYRKVGA